MKKTNFDNLVLDRKGFKLKNTNHIILQGNKTPPKPITSQIKGWPPFVYGGDADFFLTQNAKSQDWSVV